MSRKSNATLVSAANKFTETEKAFVNKAVLDEVSKDLASRLTKGPVDHTSVDAAKMFMVDSAGFDDYGKAAVNMAKHYLKLARIELNKIPPTFSGPNAPLAPMLKAA